MSPPGPCRSTSHSKLGGGQISCGFRLQSLPGEHAELDGEVRALTRRRPVEVPHQLHARHRVGLLPFEHLAAAGECAHHSQCPVNVSRTKGQLRRPMHRASSTLRIRVSANPAPVSPAGTFGFLPVLVSPKLGPCAVPQRGLPLGVGPDTVESPVNRLQALATLALAGSVRCAPSASSPPRPSGLLFPEVDGVPLPVDHKTLVQELSRCP